MLRNILRETVCMRLVLAFCIGIISYEYVHQYLSLFIVLVILGLNISLTLFYIFFLVNKYNFTFKIQNGILVIFICASFSFLLTYSQDDRNFAGYKLLLLEKQHILKVISNGKKTSNNISYEVSLFSDKYTSINSILSIKDSIINFNIGDDLIVNEQLKAIDFINHPGQFNYKQYLERKHIYHKLIANKEDVQLLHKSDGNSIQVFSNTQRIRLLNILKKNISDETSYEMAAALLLGERSDLDKQLLKSYADTGTIHIISVSGLHVGIIFIVLQFIFKRIPFLKNKFINSFCIIVCIWLYATLTGLPSSVIRSALMITFSTIGKSINNHSNPVNHVAASAIAILSYDTAYLFDIGFQLSYMAVLGIMYLQKPISDLYYPTTKLGMFVWETSSVSIAAQLFTLPLCWYYFHQFPNYFLIANLVAIPLSSAALYACIANLLFAYVPIINKICEWILVYSIKWMNNYLSWLSSWPNSVSNLNKINILQTILIGLMIFFFLLFWKEKSKYSFKYIILCLIVFTSYTFYLEISHQHYHLWMLPQGNRYLYTIESSNDFKHYYLEKMKRKNINNQVNLWKKYSNKNNTIVLIKGINYELNLDSIPNLEQFEYAFHLSNNYNRICLK